MFCGCTPDVLNLVLDVVWEALLGWHEVCGFFMSTSVAIAERFEVAEGSIKERLDGDI